MNLLAYLDPGTGSVLIQALIGIAVGAGVLVKAYWVKIRAIFGKKSNQSSDLRSKNTEKDEK